MNRKEKVNLNQKTDEKISCSIALESNDSYETSIIDALLPAQPPKQKENPKLYFNQDTQRAIVKFQSEIDKKSRDKLYVDEIMPAFEKLVENLINIHSFTGMHYTYEELKSDCVNFLFETIHKFDASLGSNAFSYFNVVAKNWLITRTKQKAQRSKKSVSLDDPASLTAHESLIIEEHDIVPPQDVLVDAVDSVDNTIKMMHSIRSKVKTENELTCINAIITIFENIDEIDLLNKSAILLYMRELSGLSPKQLATAMQSIKRHYKISRSSKSLFDI